MFNYAFVNATEGGIATFIKGESVVIPAKGRIIFTLDDTSSVRIKLAMAQAKKTYSNAKEFIIAIRTVKALLEGVTYQWRIADAEGEEVVQKAPEPEVFPAPLKTIEIEKLDPVMHVGETQTVVIKTQGFDATETLKLTSSVPGVIKVTRNGKLHAAAVGDAVITATIGDMSKKFAVEVLELKDLEG